MVTLYAYLLVGLAMGMIIAIREKDLEIFNNNNIKGPLKFFMICLFIVAWSVAWIPIMFWVLLSNKDFKS